MTRLRQGFDGQARLPAGGPHPRIVGPAPRYFCSFCGATHHERAQLLLAPGDAAAICDQCVDTCRAQIDGRLGPEATLEARGRYVATFGHGPRPMHLEDL